MAYLCKPDGQKRGKEKKDGATQEKLRTPIQLQMPETPAVLLSLCAEDRASHDCHVKILQWECRNIRPNLQVNCMYMHAPINVSFL